ncbi:hypothetical protein N7493_010817 [Penicillium malachiteum]|uniref:Uncharacterized protein n=1 Tax=Penicillium malachiteum TaxID=1324776 RepID=A0AAD6HDQ8_9EURO|nr:hypothetical protein N7493_010817 [Penicillium malachiteum]
MDENLLAAAVVLRFYEELDYIPTDVAIRGLHVFIEAQASLALSSTGLRYAAFWIGFRQEFHMAFSQQRPFRLPLDICDTYLLWDPAPDLVLVNRLFIIAAHAIQYCYKSDDHFIHTRYEELVTLRNRWSERRLPALLPVYSKPPEREQGLIFPQKWFLNDCHIVAEQTLSLGEILLIAYDPSVARIEPGQRIAMESTDARLKSTVLDICGTALSKRQEPTALLTACIAIGICGDRFTDLAEQEALMDIVINSVRDNNYWPSNALAEKLRKAWGWAV